MKDTRANAKSKKDTISKNTSKSKIKQTVEDTNPKKEVEADEAEVLVPFKKMTSNDSDSDVSAGNKKEDRNCISDNSEDSQDSDSDDAEQEYKKPRKIKLEPNDNHVNIAQDCNDEETHTDSETSKTATNFNKERSMRKILVKRLHPNTIESHIRNHFSSCGDIESLVINEAKCEAYIVFVTPTGYEAALKLHNSILNDVNITVRAILQRIKLDDDRTIILKNVEGFTKMELSKVTKIFAKCGEIENIVIVCNKNVLAFVTFKTPESVEKALNLNGTQGDDFLIAVSGYGSKAAKTQVLAKNIDKSVTEEDLMDMFKTCGPIIKITLKKYDDMIASTAIIQFATQESYCKAFALHADKLKGKCIYLEPFLEKFKEESMNGNFQKRPQFHNKMHSQRRNGQPFFNKFREPSANGKFNNRQQFNNKRHIPSQWHNGAKKVKMP